MKRIGILGLSNKSESIIKFLKKAKLFEISGVYDTNTNFLKEVVKKTKTNHAVNPFGLISQSDVLIISKSDEKSYNLIVECILSSKHVIIENPASITLNELEVLNKLAFEASVSVIPYLPFRLNNNFIKIKSNIGKPRYIDFSYNRIMKDTLTIESDPEMLLNIIDFIICLARANIKRIHANTVKIVGTTPQIINARFEFDNGCIAVLTINYISDYNKQIIDIYQLKQKISVDLIKNYSIIKTFNNNNILKSNNTKHSFSNEKGKYEEIISCLNTLEVFNTSESLLECLKNSLLALKKIEDKIVH